jgi:hypothetical protein
MSKLLDPNVPGPNKAFGKYDLSPTTDRCINCETQQKIMGTITIGKTSGPICVKCFKAYQNKCET